MRALDYFQHLKYSTRLSRKPIMMVYFLLCFGVVFVQYLFNLTLSQFLLICLLFFMAAGLYWYADFLLKKSPFIYFFIQSGIIVLCTFVAPNASPLIVLGFMAVLVIQAMYFFREGNKFIVLLVSYTALYLFLMSFYFGYDSLWLFFTMFIAFFLFVFFVLYLFNQKDAENAELQVANKRIEQLTLRTERQRMARDLHDTLAQRLVGLILKLDASEVHLQKENYEKVEAILASAKVQAKESLSDARQVIDDLRIAKSKETFLEQLQEDLEQLQLIYSLQIELKADRLALSTAEESHISAIIKEAITNVYKHANADKVCVRIWNNSQYTFIEIQDNGKGIALDTDLQKQGHYGILGMNERAKLMDGNLEIKSKNGTCLIISIPMK